MKRKIMRIANTTYVISLPLKWIREQNVEKGEEMEVLAEGDKVSISRTAGVAEDKKISIDIGDNLLAGDWLINTLYRLNYSEYEIIYSNPEFTKDIPQIINENTIGQAIISQSDRRAVIKDLSNHREEELENIQRRIFLLIKDIATDTEEFIKKGNYAELQRMYMRDTSVNQFSNYALRIVASRQGAEGKNPFALYFILKQLENIADNYRDLALYHSREELSPTKNLSAYFSRLNDLFNDYYTCFYGYSLGKINGILVSSQNLSKEIKQAISNQKDAKVLQEYIYLHQIVKLIRSIVGPLMELNVK